MLMDSGPVQIWSLIRRYSASRVDGVLLVIDPQKTSKEHIQRTMRSLETVGASILGTVMNKVR